MIARTTNSERQITGQRVGLVGLAVNLVLFGGKLTVGLLSNSIAVIADAFNNLADSVSSIVGFIGFRFAAKRDHSHPYGHGRIEYVSGMVVSIIIMMTGVSVGEAAIGRLVSPEPVASSSALVAVCAAAIVIKLALAWFVKHFNKKVKSETLNASARDNMADALATFIAILSLLVAPTTTFPVDGLLVVVVALFVLASGIKSFSDNLVLVLGQGLSHKEAREIRDVISSFDIVERVSDLDVHDYGPEAKILLAKVHLAQSPHSKEFKNEMMRIKRELNRGFGFDETIIYWPPVTH
jgi:cation diffusion facilitator family transporter